MQPLFPTTLYVTQQPAAACIGAYDHNTKHSLMKTR